MIKRTIVGVIASLMFMVANCGAHPPEVNWFKHCASCHGKDGKGKTKAGRRVKVKDLTDAKIKKRFTAEESFRHLKYGMKNEKKKQVMMSYASKLSDEEIKALVAYVRKFK